LRRRELGNGQRDFLTKNINIFLFKLFAPRCNREVTIKTAPFAKWDMQIQRIGQGQRFWQDLAQNDHQLIV
jgi:hypothetical protein